MFLPCFASTYEHSLSIEDWIHSKRRNRLGQVLVERLVHAHTNLKLEHRLELYEAGQLPWDIEMVSEEPLSHDEDGTPPPTVSPSPSPSLNPKKTLTKLLCNLALHRGYPKKVAIRCTCHTVSLSMASLCQLLVRKV